MYSEPWGSATPPASKQSASCTERPVDMVYSSPGQVVITEDQDFSVSVAVVAFKCNYSSELVAK